MCLHEFAFSVAPQASYQHNRSALPRNVPTNCGSRAPVGHRGGKQIWQLADSSHLLVAWKPTADGAAVPTELELLAAFRQAYGRLPFANMRE